MLLFFFCDGGSHIFFFFFKHKTAYEMESRDLSSACALPISCMNSGPLGGDAEIAALVVRKQVDLAIFLIDD